jgi:type I restriction enzyme M protein
MYHTWRDKEGDILYKDTPGLCKSATLAEIRTHKWSLVPGRYVGFDKNFSQQWSNEHLHTELEELEVRLKEISKASVSAISILKELLYG